MLGNLFSAGLAVRDVSRWDSRLSSMSGRSLMTTDDRREPTRDLTAKSAYVALFFALPVLLVFALLGKWEMGIGRGYASDWF